MNNLRFTENLKSAVTGNTVERYNFDAWAVGVTRKPCHTTTSPPRLTEATPCTSTMTSSV